MSYLDNAQSDASDTVDDFRDEIEEQLVEKGEASQDLRNDYSGGDAYHHENHIDAAYTLQEAAELLDDLHQYEETDEGLWQGQPPVDAISTQAAFTYGHAVNDLWMDLIDTINSEYDDLKPDEDVYEQLGMEDELEEHQKQAAEVAVNRVLGSGAQDVEFDEPEPPEPQEKPKPAPKKKGPGFEFFN